MTIDLDRYNQKVQNWTRDVVNRIKAEGNIQQVIHRPDSPSRTASLPKMRDKYRIKDGMINQASIKFPRSLIWTIKGAGKGRGGTIGSRWIDKYGNSKSTKDSSKGTLGLGRQKKDIFNKIIDGPGGVEELATIAAEELGSTIIDNMKIK